MAKSKRSRALEISPAVRRRVWHRDKECCIICGNRGQKLMRKIEKCSILLLKEVSVNELVVG
jgi:hypothetical protein